MFRGQERGGIAWREVEQQLEERKGQRRDEHFAQPSAENWHRNQSQGEMNTPRE